MKTLEFKIAININPEKVWDTLWDEESYKAWTRPFCEGSFYKAENFTEGGKIHFLTPDGYGMYSLIDKIETNKLLSFKHIGDVKNFEELPIDQETKTWSNAMEIYELTPVDNGTELKVKVDVVEQHSDFMNNAFPLALAELKKLAESQQTK